MANNITKPYGDTGDKTKTITEIQMISTTNTITNHRILTIKTVK